MGCYRKVSVTLSAESPLIIGAVNIRCYSKSVDFSHYVDFSHCVREDYNGMLQESISNSICRIFSCSTSCEHQML